MVDGIYPKNPVDFGTLDRLSRVSERYAIFTPAILYLWCGFTDSALWGFSEQSGTEMKILFRRFDKPVFRGLQLPGGDPDWNHALWFVPLADWDKFRPFLEALTFTDAVKGYVGKPGVQSVEITDPILADKGGIINPYSSIMPVDVLGWDGSNCMLGMDDDNKFPQIPIVKKYPPEEYMIEYARKFFKEVED